MNEAITPRRPRAPTPYRTAVECVDDLLGRVGRPVRAGVPLALGKPNHLVNELYRRAKEDPALELRLFTALSLEPPTAGSELERRLVEPMTGRIFTGWPELDYAADRRRGELPDNVEVAEFYLSPGALLDSPRAQQEFIASNYTDVIRDVLDRGLDLFAQLVASRSHDGEVRYSLGSNPDLSVDLLDVLDRRRRAGEPVATAAQVNDRMPYMYSEADVSPELFDVVLEAPDLHFPLYGPPNRPVRTADWWVGLHASALIRDGGTVQLGIGTMSDAVCHMLLLRQRENDAWRQLLEQSLGERRGRATAIGGEAPFERGLFANTEMLVEGLLSLYREGLLSRRVYPHAGLQRLLDEGLVGDRVSPELLERLLERQAVGERWDAAEVAALRAVGVLAADVSWEGGALERPGLAPVPADLGAEANRRRVADGFLGDRLRGGHVAHAAFFLGSSAFYRGLRELEEEQRRDFRMTRVGWTNALGVDRALQIAQRRHARFVNETMMVTALGAAVSDALEDGRVVSGVGGQYDFVAMANALEEGRSILVLASTRKDGAEVTSNVRWSYGHVTIPRQLRDLVVTEYGVADLRGKSDRQVVEEMLEITDARFQDDLVERAKRAGKLPRDYRLPDRLRRNRPERLEQLLEPARQRGLCPRFPLGSEMTEVEADLATALRSLRGLTGGLGALRELGRASLSKVIAPPAEARPYLERMGLDRPSSWSERLQRRAVLWGLARTGAI